MNILLLNNLKSAYDILNNLNNFDSQINYYDELINQYYQEKNNYPIPKSPEKQNSEKSVLKIILLLCLWPIGIFYIILEKVNHKKIEKKMNETFVNEMQKYETYCENLIEKIDMAYEERQQIIEKKEGYYNANCYLLNFIPPGYREAHIVKILLENVEYYGSKTIDKAIDKFERDAANRAIENAIDNANHTIEKAHNETMQKSEEILKNQRKQINETKETNKNLTDIYNRINRL